MPDCYLPYQTFQQANQSLANIAAIDFYLAKSLTAVLTAKAKMAEVNTIELINKQSVSVLFHSIVLVSEQLRAGNTCVDLTLFATKVAWQKIIDEEDTSLVATVAPANAPEGAKSVLYSADLSCVGYEFPAFAKWRQILEIFAINGEDEYGLVLDFEQYLYLRRYWQFETELAAFINQRLALTAQQIQPLNSTKNQSIQALLTPFFDSVKTAEPQADWQKIAVANALDQNFSIICGGPGTGKTTTVVKLLAALVAVARQQNETPLSIAMVAPTGKAAQRLSESIINAKTKLTALIDSETLAQIPEKASTIHRLLGIGRTPHKAKFNRDNQLALDVLLLDEASMVDLPLMTRLFRALTEQTKVILLGDADQLPSVATGSVLADLAPLPHVGYTAERAKYLTQLTAESIPIGESKTYLTELKVSHRFDQYSGIGELAKAVIAGQVKQADAVLDAEQYPDAQFYQPLSDDSLKELVIRFVIPLFKLSKVEDAFALLTQFRLLAATRQGEWGVESLNNKVESILKQQKCIDFPQSSKVSADLPWAYAGKPVMINENNYELNLFNGDIGLLWFNEGKLMVAFEHAEGIRWLSLARLPQFEPVFAMTIHKTQGSEFDHVALILPQTSNGILTRELLYTGITRAKQTVCLYGDQAVLAQGIKQKVHRQSALAKRLI